MAKIVGKKMTTPTIQNQETPNFKPSITNGWSPIKAYTHKTKCKDRKETKNDQVCSGTQFLGCQNQIHNKWHVVIVKNAMLTIIQSTVIYPLIQAWQMYIGHCSFTVTWWDYRFWAFIQLVVNKNKIQYKESQNIAVRIVPNILVKNTNNLSQILSTDRLPLSNFSPLIA